MILQSSRSLELIVVNIPITTLTCINDMLMDSLSSARVGEAKNRLIGSTSLARV